MNIYIEIEILKRELSGKILLSLELIKQKNNVYLTTREAITKCGINNDIPPGIIFLKDLNSEEYRINDYQKLLKNGFTLISQDEEIGCFKDKSYDKFFNDRIKGVEAKVFNYVEKFLCWGKFDHNYLKDLNLKTEFINTGSPRIDLCIDNNKYYNQNKKQILVCLNQNIFWKRDFLERYKLTLLNNTENKPIHKVADQMFKNESKDLILTLHFYNLIRKLKELDDYKIIIRPHPGMDDKKVEGLFADKSIFPNAKVSSKGALIDQISESDIIIHSGCTSAVESTLNNKVVICISPDDTYLNDYKKDTVMTKIGFSFNTSESVLEFIKNLKSKKEEIQNKIYEDKKKIAERTEIDGNSYKRISQVISEINLKKNYKTKNTDFAFKRFGNKITIKRVIKNKILKLLNINNDNQNAFEAKFPSFDKVEIEQKIKDYNINFDINSKYKIKYLNERCIKIYN